MNEVMSFEECYNTYYSKVYYHVRQHVNNDQDAEDLVDVIFMAAYKHYDNYDPDKAQLSTWLFCIANNRLKNYYRDKKDPNESLDEMFDTVEIAIEGEIEHAAELEELREVLAKTLKEELNERERTIVIKSYFENKDSNEIAEEMDLTAANVRKILSRTLKKLKPFLEGYYD